MVISRTYMHEPNIQHNNTDARAPPHILYVYVFYYCRHDLRQIKIVRCVWCWCTCKRMCDVLSALPTQTSESTTVMLLMQIQIKVIGISKNQSDNFFLVRSKIKQFGEI